jgi:hypothetical protein
MMSRRTLLRGAIGGAAVGLALPPLEAMFRTAHADVRAAPPVFGLFFWANGLPWNDKHTGSAVLDPGFSPGVHVDRWTPSTTGAGYAPSPLLQPLARHAPTVLTGLQPWTDWVTDGETDGHMRGFMVATTSDRVNPEGFYHNSHTLTASRETLDQVVADRIYGAAPPRFRALQLGVSNARFHTYGHWNAISYNGPNRLNPAIMDPGQLYDLLFGVPPDTALTDRRARLLDAVLQDYHGLQGRLGAADRARVEAHMEHLFEVQRRLEQTRLVCADPGRPNPDEDLLAKTSLMGRLLAAAIGCGLTQVFSFMLTSPATTHLFSAQGAVNDMHTTCHSGEWQVVYNITELQMRAFARLLDELAAVEVCPGVSALDAALVYGTSEYGEGWKHGVQEMPVLLAGRAAGRLRSGWHVREAGGNMAKAHLTLLQALGLPMTSFGFHGSETSATFSELLVTP